MNNDELNDLLLYASNIEELGDYLDRALSVSMDAFERMNMKWILSSTAVPFLMHRMGDDLTPYLSDEIAPTIRNINSEIIRDLHMFINGIESIGRKHNAVI